MDARCGRCLATDGRTHRLLADPNGALTPLRGNRLWQLGLLEMWLQEHGI